MYLESCRRNPELDWLFFTDNEKPVDCPQNVYWKKCSLNDIEALVLKKLYPIKVKLNRPYKLCDLRPAFGLVFEDYLLDYDYWGYGDTDVVYGKVAPFLEKIEYSKYDKINRMGHFTLVRNSIFCNNAFLTHTEGTLEVNDILGDGKNNYGFDEKEFNDKMEADRLSLYDGLWAADIDCFYKRMRCVDRRTLHKMCSIYPRMTIPVNYRMQVFVMMGGHLYRYYLLHGKVCRDEFAYIHFRKEVPIYLDNKGEISYIISRKGFYPLRDNPDSYDYITKIIKKFNFQDGPLLEEVRFFYYRLKMVWERIKF